MPFGLPPLPPLSQDDSALGGNMDTLSGLLANRQDEATTPPIKIKAESNDSGGMDMTFKMDQSIANAIIGKMQYLDQALAAMTAEANRLQAREQATRTMPGSLFNALATISGELAQDKRLPPVVSALGRASMKLNPPAQELAAQRLDLLGQEAKLAEGGGTMLHQMMSLQETQRYHRQQIERDYVTKALQAARLTAQKGGGPMDREAFSSLMRSYRVTDPDLINDAYAAHVAESQATVAGKEAEMGRQKGLATFREALSEKLAGVKGQISLRNRLAGIKYAFENSISPDKFNFEVKLHEHKKAIDEAAAGSKELRVFGIQGTNKLTTANQTNQYLDTVEHMLEQPEWAQVQGPLFQYNPATNEVKFNEQAILPKSFQNIPRTQVTSQISHEIPRLLNILLNGQAGGVRIVQAPAGQKLLRDMGISGSVRPDQALAILKIVRDTNNSNVAAVMRSKPRANFHAIRELLSVDDPRNAYYFKGRKDSFGGPVQPFPNPDQTGGGETAAPPSGPSAGGYEEWKRRQGAAQ